MEEVRVGGEAWWQRPRLLGAAACLALGAAVLMLGLRGPQPAPPGDLSGLEALAAPEAPAPAAMAPPADVVVYVSGAVARPDVYRLPAGARAKDAVLAAGGLSADADAVAINLAAPLSDAQHLHVPRQGEAAAPDPGTAAAAAPDDGQIDLNRASAADLEELPGIGRTLAERIIAHRESAGPFQSVAGLREVSGIGEKLYAEIAPLVTVR